MSGPWAPHHNQGAYPQGYQAGYQPQQAYGPPQQQYQYGHQPPHGYQSHIPPQAQGYPPNGHPQPQGYHSVGPPHGYQSYGRPQAQGYQSGGPHQYAAYQQPQAYQQYPTGPYSYQQPQQGYQPRPPYQHKVAQPSPDTCYNCGSPEHWAMNCPEPKREVPHGSMSESNRPQKRFKPNYIPPVITKYQVPPHVQSTYVSPRTYAPAPSASPGFSPQNRPHSSTPNSIQSPHHPQPPWHGSHQSNQFPGPQPYGGAVPPSPHGQVPNATPFGPPHPISQPKGIHTPPYGVENQIAVKRGSSATSAGHPTSTIGPPPLAPSQPSGPSRPASMDHSVSMDSNSEVEIEQDDLALLDVPEIPKEVTNAVNKRPQLSGHPLPAIFDPESLSSISPPDFESDGKVRSRYVTIDTIDSTLQNVKDSKDFEARKSDPLYLIIAEPLGSHEGEENSPVSEHFGPDRSSPNPAKYRNGRRDSECNSHQGSDPSRTPVYKPEGSMSPRARDAFDPNPSEYDQQIEADLKLKRPRYNPNALQPPPPPPIKTQESWGSGGNGAANSPNNNTARQYGFHSGPQHASGSGLSMPGDRNQTSPTKSYDRKRKHDGDDYEGGRSDERRRQNDDILPKHKRNQPKVAEAYSRRW